MLTNRVALDRFKLVRLCQAVANLQKYQKCVVPFTLALVTDVTGDHRSKHVPSDGWKMLDNLILKIPGHDFDIIWLQNTT